MTTKLFAFLLLLVSASAWALPEASLPVSYFSVVRPYLALRERTGTFDGEGGIKIAYRVYNAPGFSRGALVISPGRGDSMVRYEELVFDWLRAGGYDIYMIDHRGQGFSGRMLADQEIGHVESFSDYVKDFRKFMLEIVLPQARGKRYLLAHSMGGAIAAEYLRGFPNDFHAVALSAPMFEINTRPYTEGIALGIAQGAVRIGQGERFALTQGPYNPDAEFEGNASTSSRVRFALNHAFYRDIHPEIRIGGASFKWVSEAIQATRRVRENAAEIRTPLLLLQSGDDRVVKPAGQDTVCSRAASCEIFKTVGAQHDVLMERDDLRDPAMDRILEFFRAH
jgi:lysophospholipase